MTATRRVGGALPMPALVALTDAAQALFSTMFDLERDRKADLKARLTTELAGLDLFGAQEHYADHEDYVIGGPGSE
jgi:hypothetical protein